MTTYQVVFLRTGPVREESASDREKRQCDEAKALAAGDPAVKVGRLVIDAHPWMTFKEILR